MTLLGPSGHEAKWQALGEGVGLEPWPALKPLPSPTAANQTVGETAECLARHATHGLIREEERWPRELIERTVRDLMEQQFFITEFQWTDQFARDLGLN